MHNPHARRHASPRRGQRREITFKIHITSRPIKAEGKRGTTWRVTWSVAGHARGRTFHSIKRAEAFRSMLENAANQGQPFDVNTGFPVLPQYRPCRGSRRRRSNGGPYA